MPTPTWTITAAQRVRQAAQHVTFPRIGPTVNRRPPEHRQATDHSPARSAPATVTCQSCHVRHVDQSAFRKSSHAPPTQQQQRPPAVKLVIRMLILVATTTLQTLLTFLDSITPDYHLRTLHRYFDRCWITAVDIVANDSANSFGRSKCGKVQIVSFPFSGKPICHQRRHAARALAEPTLVEAFSISR